MAKKALLIGINAYDQSALRGCVNDASAMYDLLTQQFGFPPDDVRVVVDDRATAQAIKDRLDWLVTGLAPGDVAVLHFSGHGSQVRDRGPQDELADHKDEILCPVDLDWQENVVTDDDLASFLGKVPPGAFCYVVLDCCHSGTGTRDLRPPGEDRPLSLNPGHEVYRKERFLPPPFDIEARSLGRSLPVKKFGRGRAKKRSAASERKSLWSWLLGLFRKKPAPAPAPEPKNPPAEPEMNHVLISGCRSDQTSADAYIGGRYTGALTHHLTKAVRENPGKSAAEVHSIARQAILSEGFSQESQLEGPSGLTSRPIFS